MAAVPLSVCISGALGNVGRRLVEGVRDDPGFTLHSAVARREVGRDVGEALGGAPLGVVVTDDIEVALATGPDVLIDYTHPTLIRRHLDVAFARGVPVVIGTTGLSDADFEQIDEAARAAGLGAVTGNFAITAALLQHLAKIAAPSTSRTGRWWSTTRHPSPTSRAARRASWPSCSVASASRTSSCPTTS